MSTQAHGRPNATRMPTSAAVRDLALVVTFVWVAVVVIVGLDVPAAISAWSDDNEQWAIDEVTLVSLCVGAAFGVFAWRRWRESLSIIERYEATVERLRLAEDEISARDRLISSVSHELRTPLTGILGYAELLRAEDVDPMARAGLVDDIVSQGWDLAYIVEDLLTRARVEADSLRVAEVPVSLRAQATQVLEAWEPERAAAVEMTGEEARALGDPARVRQIVRNLLTNAARYGSAPMGIDVGTRDGRAYVAVSDGGPGVPETEAASIFDPYHRVDATDSAPGGLGLGLAISRELAQLMGGDLTYRRRRGTTTFELSLPIAVD
ncbi:MAG: HAMP domain-containing sensor histidine kinase [Acidimicrobiia bacterium]|nr:HAMP domain-containing sensor histidine kinase [Acidimicrobiia bacterium]